MRCSAVGGGGRASVVVLCEIFVRVLQRKTKRRSSRAWRELSIVSAPRLPIPLLLKLGMLQDSVREGERGKKWHILMNEHNIKLPRRRATNFGLLNE
jgi:hypothetical protein